jgi:rubredoxin
MLVKGIPADTAFITDFFYTDTQFEDLPEDWKCPGAGRAKRGLIRPDGRILR